MFLFNLYKFTFHSGLFEHGFIYVCVYVCVFVLCIYEFIINKNHFYLLTLTNAVWNKTQSQSKVFVITSLYYHGVLHLVSAIRGNGTMVVCLLVGSFVHFLYKYFVFVQFMPDSCHLWEFICIYLVVVVFVSLVVVCFLFLCFCLLLS